jgi:hypothetical protein
METHELITLSYPAWQWAVGVVVGLVVWDKWLKRVWNKVWQFLTK